MLHVDDDTDSLNQLFATARRTRSSVRVTVSLAACGVAVDDTGDILVTDDAGKQWRFLWPDPYRNRRI